MGGGGVPLIPYMFQRGEGGGGTGAERRAFLFPPFWGHDFRTVRGYHDDDARPVREEQRMIWVTLLVTDELAQELDVLGEGDRLRMAVGDASARMGREKGPDAVRRERWHWQAQR